MQKRGVEGESIGAVLNMVLISVILDGFEFKYKINKKSEKNKYFKNTKQQKKLQAVYQLSTN